MRDCLLVVIEKKRGGHLLRSWALNRENTVPLLACKLCLVRRFYQVHGSHTDIQYTREFRNSSYKSLCEDKIIHVPSQK